MAPYASKTCLGPNPDATVSQGQQATCTVSAATGGPPYIAGDRVTIHLAGPLTMTSCEGVAGTSYETSASIGENGDQCRFTVASGSLTNGQVIGTEEVAASNTVPSGTSMQQSAVFCSAPGPDGEGVCNAVPRPIQVTGPAATVVDEIPPTFTGQLPSLEPIDATSPAGAVATYTVEATDNAPEAVSVDCSPPSGSTFAIGTTLVICTATDGSGNATMETFAVRAINTFESLCRVMGDQVSNPGIRHSLCVKLQNAAEATAAGNTGAANGMLNAFVNEVEAQSGRAIDPQAATNLEGLARLLIVGDWPEG